MSVKYAERSNYDVVVQVDADGQHDPSDVVRLVRALDYADVVIGARFADLATTPYVALVSGP